MANALVVIGIVLGVGGKVFGLAYAGIVKDISTKTMGALLFTGYGFFLIGMFAGGRIPGT
ncbi:MAG: hypothetical protein ACR2LK_10755 [Solirubrobacteraceae bacterium]